MPTDTFETELRAAFDDIAAGIPDAAAARVAEHRYAPRSRRRVVIPAACVAIAVAGAGAGALVLNRQSSHAGRAAHAGTGAQAPRVQLIAQVRKAVAAANGDMFHAVSTAAGAPRGERWASADGSRLHIAVFDAAGTKTEDILYVTTSPGHVDATVVNDANHTWSQESDVLPPVPAGATPAQGPAVAKNVAQGPTSAAQIEQMLVADGFTKTGTGVVDGMATYTISATLGDTTIAIAVDDSTNLPVHVHIGQPANPSIVDSSIQWLPVDQSLLTLTPPAGYTHVANADAS
ncbi:MAG TPA: hypothetical protein VGO03_18205 [Acidimicrobiia bacterium]|jgi:hypothetical protein